MKCRQSYGCEISRNCRDYTPNTILASIFNFRLISRASFDICSHLSEYSHLKREGLTPISLARDFFYTFHFVWSCWRMLVRNEFTKGYADSEPDVYRRHGSSMYTGLLWRQSLMCMVSGCRPRQDSLIVFPKTMYQTVTNDNTIIPKKKFCGLGLQVEFCYPGSWHVGVGISCNLIMW